MRKSDKENLKPNSNNTTKRSQAVIAKGPPPAPVKRRRMEIAQGSPKTPLEQKPRRLINPNVQGELWPEHLQLDPMSAALDELFGSTSDAVKMPPPPRMLAKLSFLTQQHSAEAKDDDCSMFSSSPS